MTSSTGKLYLGSTLIFIGRVDRHAILSFQSGDIDAVGKSLLRLHGQETGVQGESQRRLHDALRYQHTGSV